MPKYLLLLSIILIWGCSRKEMVSITIVDIGYVDRTEIAKELRIVNKYKPKVIGLDFLLTADSLEKDIPLAEELAKTKNMVRAMVLHNNHPTQFTRWDSLEQFHAKFRFGKEGFSNITITDDSIIVREMPMRQFIQENIQYAFSYQVASQYDYYKVKPKYEIGTRDFLFDESIFNYSFKIISAEDLLAGKFRKRDLKDHIVLMGLVSDEDYLFYRDESKTKRISGIEYQACLIRQILN